MQRSAIAVVVSTFVVALCAATARVEADWPQHRADAGRSGYVADTLPTESLKLSWVYASPHAPSPAWPRLDRMAFDRAMHIVSAHGLIYFGHSVTGTIHALDAATGELRWTFFTESPARFAPVVWRDRVLAVSDDGRLYCLDAKSGRLHWSKQGGLDDRMILGNGHLVSKWPARGGPVVFDDTVYFAAGIWPSDGVQIYAVDPMTGEAKWVNDQAGFIHMPQPHGGAEARSGVSAQGYLAATERQLFVPTGRAVPAAFSRADGRFEYFHLQRNGRLGGSSAMAGEGFFVNGGCRFDAAGGGLEMTIGGGESALTPGGLVRVEDGKLTAGAWAMADVTDRKGQPAKQRVIEATAEVAEVNADAAVIVTGRVAYAGGEGRVAAVDLESKRIVWSAEVKGTAYGLAADGGRLYVSTDAGHIYCFDARGGGASPVVHRFVPDESPYGDNAAYARAAERIIQLTGVTEGYCVDLGGGNGALAFELAKRTRLQICVVEPDEAAAVEARRRLSEAGLYGSRVTVHVMPPDAPRYPKYFANLIVSAVSITTGKPPADEAAIRRLQRPYGGTTCFGAIDDMRVNVRGELAGAGKWTHQYAGPGNTTNSEDELVRGPLGMLWFRDIGQPVPQRHGRGPSPLFLDGRLYSEGLDNIVCVDAYNGRLIWQYELPGILKAFDGDHLMGTSGTGSNYCINDHSVYVRRDDHCLRLDAKTGELLATFKAPPPPQSSDHGSKPAPIWGFLAVEDDILYGTLANPEHVVPFRYLKGGDMTKQLTESVTLFAMNAKTGEVLWRYDAKHSIRHNAMAIGLGKVYLIDRPLALTDRAKQRATAESHPTGELVALDALTGAELWRNREDVFGTTLMVSAEHHALVMSYQPTRFRLESEVGGRIAALRTSDGQRLWDKKAEYESRPVINGSTIYAQGGAWDLMTGEDRPFNFSRSYGCGILAGAKNLFVYRSATLGYFDLTLNERNEDFGGLRPGCWINALPAGGLVLVPDASAGCECSYQNQSWIALQNDGLRPPRIVADRHVSRDPITVTLAPYGEDPAAAIAQLRYTLDGSDPTGQSPLYREPIRITRSAVLRARAFGDDDAPPSRIADEQFIVEPDLLDLDGEAWRIWDAPGANSGPSQWSVRDGVAHQKSNIYLAPPADRVADLNFPRYGTLRIYQPGEPFTDGELTLQLRCSDNDQLGVAFRLADESRHYLYTIDLERGFHLLAVRDGEEFRPLAHNAAGYSPDTWHTVRIVLEGPKIAIYFDGRLDLEATDATIASGTFALHVWGSTGAEFRAVRWRGR